MFGVLKRAKGVSAVLVAVLCAAPAFAAELKPATAAAFDRYQAAAEAAMDPDLAAEEGFLRGVRGTPEQRRSIDDQLKGGEVVVTKLQVKDGRRDIDIPDALVHHWVATAFAPNVRLDAAVALLQAYDTHATLFKPNVVRSKTLEHEGDRFKLFLRFYFKKVIAVTVDTESIAEFTRRGPNRVSSSIRSTRINEIENPETAQERQLPEGQGGGYLWRLNTYWRFLEKDGGTYIECESLTLTRDTPFGLGWIIGPFITSIPRETLTNTLRAARRGLLEHTAKD